MTKAFHKPPSLAGRILYRCWYWPRGIVARSMRAGGPWNQWLDRVGESDMKAAVATLPRPTPTVPPRADLHMLVGKRFVHQALWAFVTFARHAEIPVRLVVHDDGSLDASDCATIHDQAPGTQVRGIEEINSALDALLPESRFPALRATRVRYVQLRKLTDVFASREPARMLIDSDVLFFRKPAQMLDWLVEPSIPLVMRDVGNAYGYAMEVLETLAGAPIPERVNTGILALDPARIDWERIEHWTATLLNHHGSSYYMEQALVAMLLARTGHAIANPDDHIVMPSFDECMSPTAAMHHYVDTSRRGYFRAAWKSALARLVGSS